MLHAKRLQNDVAAGLSPTVPTCIVSTYLPVHYLLQVRYCHSTSTRHPNTMEGDAGHVRPHAENACMFQKTIIMRIAWSCQQRQELSLERCWMPTILPAQILAASKQYQSCEGQGTFGCLSPAILKYSTSTNKIIMLLCTSRIGCLTLNCTKLSFWARPHIMLFNTLPTINGFINIYFRR